MASAPRPPGPDGLLVVDKPPGWTSHDVVARGRRLLSTRRVGHAGTLDPMATGVLVLGVGRCTKLLTYLVGADKDYTATVVLGASTVTDDAEGGVTARADPAAVAALTRQRLEAAVAALTGAIEQVPSAVSAIKVDGQRSYARVRAGEEVVLAARPVTVSTLDVLAVRPHPDRWEVDVAATVSSGTYVRALARDLGAALGVGGHLSVLRRTRVGVFDLTAAHALERLEGSVDLLSPADGARRIFPVREVSTVEVGLLSHGRRLEAAGEGPDPVAAIGPDGALVALVRREGDLVRPVLVLTPA